MLLSKKIDDCIFEVLSEKPNFPVKHILQVHGNIIAHCSNAHPETQADGIICTCNKCTLAIKTADCLPIAVIGFTGYALIHAGWRGLQAKIIDQDILAQITPHSFYIGPHIKQKAYEVGEDFFQNFPEFSPVMMGDKFHCSLQEIAYFQIKKKYPKANIEYSDICTFEDISYNSYRRNKTTLRNWNILKKGQTHE